MSRYVPRLGRSVGALLRQETSVAGPSVCRRGMTSAAAEPSKEPTSYPFNKKAVFPPSQTPKPIHPRLLTPKKGWAIIRAHDEAARRLRDPKGLCGTLFSRRHPDRLRPGSILSVITYTNMEKNAVTSFSGVLMGVKRTGSDYSFRVRNIVNKVGVEVQYKVLSPWIKEIKVIRRAEKAPGPGGIKALRQANAYYLRDRPELMKNLANILRQDHLDAKRAAAADK